MSHYYVTITLHGPSHDEVVGSLRQQRRQAYVSLTSAGYTVVYDAECDDQDTDAIIALTAELSAILQCPAMVVLNHADDLLWYALYVRGELQDRYDSNPGWFGPEASISDPSGGDAARLCAAFACPQVEQVACILREPNSSGTYPLAVMRHIELAQALNLPDLSVGIGYEDIADGNLPEDVAEDLFHQV
jgi:hypothetical protein